MAQKARARATRAGKKPAGDMRDNFMMIPPWVVVALGKVPWGRTKLTIIIEVNKNEI
jgi:hypothetical protein